MTLGTLRSAMRGRKCSIRWCPNGFRHNEQSLRVADKLENLNLTVEVRDGMLNHSGDGRASTLEGQLIKFADRIAYINHDIDDALGRGDLAATSRYWKKYETPVGETADRWNDAYLKANDQTDGVQSYGRMVDLLIAFYRAQGLI